MPGALEGLKVIDLSRVLGGPYCGQMLADHGADVIKIEPPQGDETRTWGPPFDKEGISAYFAGINRNKRTIALDLSKPEGREVLLKLLGEADVLIDNFKTEQFGAGHIIVCKNCRDAIDLERRCDVDGFDTCVRVGRTQSRGPEHAICPQIT